MGKISKKRKAACLRVNKGREILLLGHPLHKEWGAAMELKMTDHGINVCMNFDTTERDAMLAILEECASSGKRYDCVVIVPGHGCSAAVPIPGLIWSENALSKKRCHLIKGNKLAEVVNKALLLTNHLHFCTCNQGCMLDMYDKLVSDDRTATEYVLSGWLHAMTFHDRDVDVFVSNGCHHTGKVRHDKFRFLHRKPAEGV